MVTDTLVACRLYQHVHQDIPYKQHVCHLILAVWHAPRSTRLCGTHVLSRALTTPTVLKKNRMNRQKLQRVFQPPKDSTYFVCVRYLVSDDLRKTSWRQWYSMYGYFCTTYLNLLYRTSFSPIFFLELCKITPNLICKPDVLPPKPTQEFRWCMYFVNLHHGSPGSSVHKNYFTWSICRTFLKFLKHGHN